LSPHNENKKKSKKRNGSMLTNAGKSARKKAVYKIWGKTGKKISWNTKSGSHYRGRQKNQNIAPRKKKNVFNKNP